MKNKEEINVFWFRRDLRLFDNVGLAQALSQGLKVLPIFIFDPNILLGLTDKKDKRVAFIYNKLQEMNQVLNEIGSSILILHETPIEAFNYLFENYNIKSVFYNNDYEPYARRRDADIKKLTDDKSKSFFGYKDHVIFEKEDITLDSGKPYQVFTPYSKKWKKHLTEKHLSYHNCDLSNFLNHAEKFPKIETLGFENSYNEPTPKINDLKIDEYHEKRDFPAKNGTTKLSVHLRFGTISIRELATYAKKENETFLNELIWRDFYSQNLYHFPESVDSAIKTKYDNIPWRRDEEGFEKWKQGMTGYPLVDAGMRELNNTGFMHNRVRMVVASFLTKHLLIDWRWGESYFAEKLLDYDQASNVGGWQWASGSGNDAAPYFRVFNPTTQQQKFDKEGQYIRQWIPEINELTYPNPMVEHSFARTRAIEHYKKHL